MTAAFHAVPLARHPTYVAHIRANDYAVVLARGERSSAELFAEVAGVVDERQGIRPAPDQKRTFTLYLVLAGGCNLQCTYCDVLEPGRRGGPCLSHPDGAGALGAAAGQAVVPGAASTHAGAQPMTWETASRALAIMAARLERDPALHAQVVFFGGEPLLAWPLLQRICDDIARRFPRDRVAKMLVTNGTLVSEERAVFLLEHRVYVVVSLDGGQEVNDRVRVGIDGRGSFARVWRGLGHLARVMPGRFGISCTVGSHNAASLGRELAYLHEEVRPCCIGVNIYHYHRDGTSPIAIDSARLTGALLEAFRVARERGIGIYQYIGIARAFIRRRRNLDYCPACVDKLLFTPEGRVGRCETLMDDPRFTVALREVADVDLPPHLDWTRYTPEHEAACQECAARWICPGSCAYDQLVTTGELHGVEERRCSFHRAFLTEMLDLLLERARADGASPEATVVVPRQADFDGVVGTMPLTFPDDTIWIVSLSHVGEASGG